MEATKLIVAGAVDGIPMQFPAGFIEYLVSTVEECSAKVLFLLDNPDVAAEFGKSGKERESANNFLCRARFATSCA